jgi:oligoribonuclease (3'-5' exoribonuclease)
MKLDEMATRVEPPLAILVESVVRSVVDDQEHLPTVVAENELPQEFEEGGTVEDVRESERELRVVERERTEYVRRFTKTIGVDAWLNSDARPRSMQASVLPEARFVLENYDSATPGGFF